MPTGSQICFQFRQKRGSVVPVAMFPVALVSTLHFSDFEYDTGCSKATVTRNISLTFLKIPKNGITQ